MDALTHFHILWFLPRYDGEDYIDGVGLQSRLYTEILSNWVVNVGSKRKPEYKPLCTFKQRYVAGQIKTNYDTHFVTPSLTEDGISSVAFYVCKYMMKQNDKERRLQRALRLNLHPVDYEQAFSVVKSRSLRSEHFGYGFDTRDYYTIIDYLRQCVDKSKGLSPYPCFFSPDSSKSFPLCGYYRHNPYIFDMADWMDFKMADDSIYIDYDKTPTQCDNAIKSFERLSQMVDEKDFSLDLNFELYG